MLEITTHQFLFFKRKEFWFYDTEKISKATYHVFCYSQEKDASSKKDVLKQQTSLVNLEKTEEELFNKVNRTFIYHIHKAERVGITAYVDYSPTMQKCCEVMNEFSVFANEKNIEWNPKRIIALQKLNKLIISEAFIKEEKIVTHVYLHDGNRVILLHSYHSPHFTDEKVRGYANKLLHWKDIIGFKSFGLNLYDFGGINLQQHPGISKFKLSFGGDMIDCYSYMEANPVLSIPISLFKRLKL